MKKLFFILLFLLGLLFGQAVQVSAEQEDLPWFYVRLDPPTNSVAYSLKWDNPGQSELLHGILRELGYEPRSMERGSAGAYIAREVIEQEGLLSRTYRFPTAKVAAVLQQQNVKMLMLDVFAGTQVRESNEIPGFIVVTGEMVQEEDVVLYFGFSSYIELIFWYALFILPLALIGMAFKDYWDKEHFAFSTIFFGLIALLFTFLALARYMSAYGTIQFFLNGLENFVASPFLIQLILWLPIVVLVWTSISVIYWYGRKRGKVRAKAKWRIFEVNWDGVPLIVLGVVVMGVFGLAMVTAFFL